MTTLNLQVGASTDDADESTGGTVDLTDTNIKINAAGEWVGFRFQNVTVPNGATINSATLQVSVIDDDDPDVIIYGEDIDDAPTFSSSSNDISSRTPTTASVTWDASAIGTGFQSAPDIATIIQEIVDRVGWSSGNDLVIMAEGQSASPINISTYNSSSSVAAKLDIDYTAGGGGGISIPVVVQHLKQQGIQ